jgi:hypothetical protein
MTGRKRFELLAKLVGLVLLERGPGDPIMSFAIF